LNYLLRGKVLILRHGIKMLDFVMKIKGFQNSRLLGADLGPHRPPSRKFSRTLMLLDVSKILYDIPHISCISTDLGSNPMRRWNLRRREQEFRVLQIISDFRLNASQYMINL
jgi:hypothetical protein